MSMATKDTVVKFEQLECYIREPPIQTKHDSVSLFGVLQDVLHHTTSTAEKCLLGNNKITIPECKQVASLNCPLSVLKKLQCLVTCEVDGGDASASVARILSNYSEAGRAVMTLAAFAMSYEDLLFYVENRTLNPFASLRTFEIIRVQRDDNFKKAIMELNTLITLTVELVKFILQLENLSKEDHFIDNFSLVRAINTNIINYSSLAIRVLVTCMRQVNCLTYDMVMTGKGLSSVVDYLDVELKNLEEIYRQYKSQTVESKSYKELHNIIRRGGNIVDVMTRMMFPQQPFFECYNRPPVEVEKVLTGNSVLLFITELNISEDDYSVLRMIHEQIEQQRLNYKIVWIPIVRRKREYEGKGWRMEELNRLNDWKKVMPWYFVNYETSKPILGVRYIKETWNYSYNPMVVVLNQSGMVECSDAMHIIRAWRTWPCPYNFDPIVHPDPGMRPIIFPFVKGEIVEEEYIIFYGGKDLQWITKFGTIVKTLAVELGKAKITLTPFALGEKNSTMDITQFWTRVESLGCARLQWNLFGEQHIHTTTQIQKLISLKEESGWAMVCKGSSVIACGSGTILMNTVAEYKIWIKEIGKYGFESCFTEYLKKKRLSGGERIPCCHVPFKGFNGWLPVDVECPDCGERMERIVTYKCCHPTLYK